MYDQTSCLYSSYHRDMCAHLICIQTHTKHTHTLYVVDKVLNGISQDLKESGLYFKYMETDGADE